MFSLSDLTFRVHIQKQVKQEKHIVFLELFCFNKSHIWGLWGCENKIYHQNEDIISIHLIIIRPLAHLCIENMSSYIVAIVRYLHSNVVKTHLMTISLYLCGFLPLIINQLSLASKLGPCVVKRNIRFVFALAELMFRLYMYMQKWCKSDIFGIFSYGKRH